ncbi:hypothetical protein [Proteus sp. NMG38-2]|uniref:hypothetical protein n=1 Tax=Proteus sp. NMG38-2 TaxID=2883107 RepID=UPI001D0B88C8|nr:hypothetical protein [Proteus sp. NMG38-2]UDN34527.1 hypothetical protein LG402_12210 [Proteus sp. NMG38-2]
MYNWKFKKHLLFSLAALAGIISLTGCTHQSYLSCPSLVGTYISTETQVPSFYIQKAKNDTSDYLFFYGIGNKRYIEKKAILIKYNEENKDSIIIPNCSLGVNGVGVLREVKKGEPYTSILRSPPEPQSDEKFTGDHIFILPLHLSLKIINVEKISNSGVMPPDAQVITLPKPEPEINQENYERELALAKEEANKNNPAAQLFLAKSSYITRYGFKNLWYASNHDPETRTFWLNKALANDYGPAYCYQAATHNDHKLVFSVDERIKLYQQALAKGNAPLAGVYLADLTRDPAQKMQYLITAVRQGSFLALWRLGALPSEKQATLPADIQKLIKAPPFDQLKKVSPSVWKSYESGKDYKEWRDNPYLFDMEYYISKKQLYGKTGADLDYNQKSRADCLEQDLLKLSDYPQ